ncbi:MAG: flagellar hook-length control protein FliK [Bacillota bacterium]
MQVGQVNQALQRQGNRGLTNESEQGDGFAELLELFAVQLSPPNEVINGSPDLPQVVGSLLGDAESASKSFGFGVSQHNVLPNILYQEPELRNVTDGSSFCPKSEAAVPAPQAVINDITVGDESGKTTIFSGIEFKDFPVSELHGQPHMSTGGKTEGFCKEIKQVVGGTLFPTTQIPAISNLEKVEGEFNLPEALQYNLQVVGVSTGLEEGNTKPQLRVSEPNLRDQHTVSRQTVISLLNEAVSAVNNKWHDPTLPAKIVAVNGEYPLDPDAPAVYTSQGTVDDSGVNNKHQSHPIISLEKIIQSKELDVYKHPENQFIKESSGEGLRTRLQQPSKSTRETGQQLQQPVVDQQKTVNDSNVGDKAVEGFSLVTESAENVPVKTQVQNNLVSKEVQVNQLPSRITEMIRAMAIQQNLGQTTVRMKLQPEQLGEVTVKLTWAKGELTAQFITATAIAREALESSFPHLKELLAQQDIRLSEAAVFMGQQNEQWGQQNSRQWENNNVFKKSFLKNFSSSISMDPLTISDRETTTKQTGVNMLV